MTPEQQHALEELIGKSLSEEQILAIDSHIAHRDDVAIAKILSEGRVRTIPRAITERGIRSSLPISLGSRFIVLMKGLQTARPTWLDPLLTQMGIPSDQHDDYYETLSCAFGWLTQEAGVDVGSATARNMLDLIAAGEPSQAPAIAAIKALAEQPDPLDFNKVSDALNKAEGRMTL